MGEVPTDIVARRNANRSERALFRDYQETGERRIRNEIAERHLHLADLHAKRYGNRGVPYDDLRQVGLLAMVRAIDRFDVDQGIQFSTFASRTIEGELKRYFRDRTWMVRPPRRAQELHLDIRGAQNDLQQTLGRVPTARDLADHLDVTLDAVIEAMEAGAAHGSTSLDAPTDDERPTAPAHALGIIDHGFDVVDSELVVRELLERLAPRERAALYLRFYENKSQPEIARALGISQSYASRVIRSALASLRTELAEAS
jgi:RNA polymerase sigma-B factor